jgi:hypothetical protein
MAFLTYEGTRPWAKAIKEAVLTRKMPPWFADPKIGHFANERRLSDSEIKRISDWVVEMHYTASGKVTEDQTKVGFILAKEPPARRLLNLMVMEFQFEIPPNAPNHPGTTWAVLNEPATLIYTQPHLHMRGKDMDIKLTYPNGETRMLVSVPRYNYLWQTIYVEDKPLELPKDTRIDISAHWDNSANNPFNPDPSKTIRWGDQSWDEMLVGFVGVTVDRNVDPQKILSMRGASAR